MFPSRYGQRLMGVEKTPEILKDVLNGTIKNVHCTDDLDENLYNLYNENMKTYSKKVNIGGDHSMSIATVSSSLHMHRNLKVLWIDAHADINTRVTSKTKNVHGMPLGFLTKLDRKNFKFRVPKLDFRNLMYVGIRDLDIFEKEILKEYNVRYIKSESLNINPNETLMRIKRFINGCPVHISFDVDSLDPKYMKCTGTKYKDGLNVESTKKVLDGLLSQNIVNMDITELNMELGTKEDQQESIYNFLKLFENYLPLKN